MSDVVIKVEGLGKRYRIGGSRADYGTFRDTLVEVFRAPVRRAAALMKGQAYGAMELEEEIWALKDVSLEVQQGEIVGLIGRNGAGKTTLLKILSRITEPTEGYAEIHGRVRSLLEVGTGFHQELTGRENVYLNGAILGMRKEEINRKFDEIVAFSEVERFLDTPVKFYSSGMRVRLAFAVAAHLDPEILLVDEVLAVGDIVFQKKCMGRMRDVAVSGRTVLFVSHNMTAVRKLCSRAILLHQGRLIRDGNVNDVVNAYLDSDRINRFERVWDELVKSPGNDIFRLHSVRLIDNAGNICGEVDTGQPFNIEIEYWNLRDGSKLGATIALFNQEGICIFSSVSNHESRWHGIKHPKGLFRSVCHIPGNLLSDGYYSVTAIVWDVNFTSAHREDRVIEFTMIDKSNLRGGYLGGWAGVVRPMLEWETEYLISP